MLIIIHNSTANGDSNFMADVKLMLKDLPYLSTSVIKGPYVPTCEYSVWREV